jgi:hypothetical protein
MIASEYEAYPKFEPMKQRFKKKYRKSSPRELIFNDDIDSLGRDNRYYRSKYNDKKPKWRAKRREQRRSKRKAKVVSNLSITSDIEIIGSTEETEY